MLSETADTTKESFELGGRYRQQPWQLVWSGTQEPREGSWTYHIESMAFSCQAKQQKSYWPMGYNLASLIRVNDNQMSLTKSSIRK